MVEARWRLDGGWAVRALLSQVLALALAAGCGGRASHSGPVQNSNAGAASTGGGSNSFGGAATDGGSASAGIDSGGGSTSEVCAPGHAPLRRLTRAEYVSSLRALFGDVTDITALLP